MQALFGGLNQKNTAEAFAVYFGALFILPLFYFQLIMPGLCAGNEFFRVPEIITHFFDCAHIQFLVLLLKK